VEDALISCLPDLPEDETREEQPDVVQNGIMKGVVTPVCYGVPYAASVPVGSAHDLGPLIPDLLAVATAIEEMLFGFLVAMA
jgi:hypothetical protein